MTVPASRHASHSRRSAVWAPMVALLGPLSAAFGQTGDVPAPIAASGRVRHVLALGDFETMAAVSRLGVELERAAADGDGLFVLEMDGDRGRSEVALAIFDLLRSSRTPVAVYLSDAREHRVGSAQLCAALGGTERLVDPSTRVEAMTGDDLEPLSPQDSAEDERIARQLSGAVYARLAEIGGPCDLATVLVPAPGEPWPRDAWAIFPGGGALPSVVFEDPANSPERPGTPERLSHRSTSGSISLTISAERLARLGVVRAKSASVSGVAASLGVRGVVGNRVVIDFTLAGPRASVERDLAEVDGLLRRATDDLDLPLPARKDISPDRYRRASAAARGRVNDARALIERSEAVVAAYPELTRTPAPGQTDVAGKASVFASRWRSAFQSRSDRASKLEDKAATLDQAGRR